MKNKIMALAAAAAFAFPLVSLAATYGYINNSGTLSFDIADNAQTALSLAVNADPHSGVFLATPEMLNLLSSPAASVNGSLTGGVIITPTDATVTYMTGSSTVATTSSSTMTSYYFGSTGDIVYATTTPTAYMTATTTGPTYGSSNVNPDGSTTVHSGGTYTF